MKIGIGNWARPFASVWRVVVFTLIVCATGQAWAAAYETTGYEAFGSTDGVVLWRAKSTEGNFHASTVINVAEDGTKGTEYQMKVYNANPTGDQTADKTIAWQRFASNQDSVYAAPGKVLVYDETGYRESSDAQFAPLSFGGLYVKALAAEGKPYTIIDNKSDTSDRKVELGASDYSTVFKFEKSFTFDRNSATEVKGTATVDIDSGATFTINARANKGAKVDSGNTLILKGSGTLAVTGGLSVGGTLDISNSPATIDGDVILSSGSTLVLPAGTAKDETISIPVCSGTLTVVGTVNAKIGADDAVSADIAVSGGTITSVITDTNLTRTYTTTVNGDANFSTLSWEKGGVTCDWGSGDSVSATISVSAASIITIDKAVTLNALTINNTSGGAVTLRIAGSSTLTAASISIPANVTLEVANPTAITASSANISGAGNIAFASGTFTLNGNNSSLTGNIIVKNGAKIVAGTTNAFGRTGNSSATRRVIAESGGTIDINGKAMGLIYRIAGDGEGEGALINKVASALGSKAAQMCGLELTGSASVNSTGYFGVIASNYNTGILDIPDGCTLTKYGSNDFYLCNISGGGRGKIVVSAGMLFFRQNAVSIPNVTIEVSGSSSYIGGDANLTAKKVKFMSGGTLHSSWTGFNITVDELEVASGSTYSYPGANNRLSTGTLVIGGVVNWNAYALKSTAPTSIQMDGGTFNVFHGNGDTKALSSEITGAGSIVVWSNYATDRDQTFIDFTGDTTGFTGTTTVKNGTLIVSTGGEGSAVTLSSENDKYGKLKFKATERHYNLGYKPNITRSSEDYNTVSYTYGDSAIAAEYIDGVNLLPQGPTIECVASSTVDFGTVDSWTNYSGESAPSSGCIVIQAATSATLNIDETATFDAILIRGSGAVTLAGSGSLTTRELIIDDAVTLNVNSNGIVLSTDGTISGTGTLNVPNGISYALDGVDCSVAITAGTNSTLSFKDSTINGGVSAPQDGNVTINTYGTVSFGSSANNDFQYSTTLNVESGTTTYNSKDGRKFWCTINVKSGATLVNDREDGFNWGAPSNYPIHAHIWGTLTLNQKWTIGAGNYIHLYNGALINGTASNALHFNTENGHIVAEEGDSIITASFVKGAGTIAVEVKSGATLSTVETPEIATRTGEGKLLKRVQNARWDGGVPPANYDGVERYSSTSGTTANGNTETFLNSALTGIFKVTTENDGYVILGWVGNGSFTNPIFSGRPTLWANGDIRIYHATSDKPFTVNNLSGSGYLKNGNIAGEDSNVNKYIDTLQTEDTIYSGVLPASEKAVGDPALTVRGDSELHSLTLTGASDTTGPLTIENKAKVVFSSTGKWSGGTVTVKNGGVLESQNSDDVAATLVVEKGATLKFADGVALAATEYVWSDVAGELENSEKIKVDLDSVTPASEVTLIASGVTIDADKFTVTASKYGAEPTLSVVNGALKATYSDNLCVDGTWLVGPTANQAATIFLNESSTLTTASDLTLGVITAYNISGTAFTLTTAGAGELTLGGMNAPYSEITLNVGSKVTIIGSIAGATKINVLNGGELTIDGVACDKQITIQSGGKLYTKGTTALSAANTSEEGGLIRVISGTTTLAAQYSGIAGDITIDAGATLVSGDSWSVGSKYIMRHLNPEGSSTIDISGTLQMDTKYWVLGSGITMNLRAGALITGSQYSSNYGNFEWSGSGTINAYGTSTNSAYNLISTGFAPTFNVSEGVTLKVDHFASRSSLEGSIVKAGAGILDVTANALSRPLTVNAGQVIAAAVPTANVTINENGTFTLKDTEWTSGNVFSGTGILELYSATAAKAHTITGSTFGGILKLSNVVVPGSNPPQHQNNINPASAAMFDSSVRPEFVCDSTATHLGGGYYKSDSTKIEVRNLSGAGSLRAQWTSGADCHYTIETKQTKATAFTGTIAAEDGDSKDGGGKYTRYINLSVIGDDSETPNSLTITQRQNTRNSDSSQALSTLTVSDNAKVIFSENGGWGYGHVIVGDDGYLECTNNAAVKKLTLNDGATLVFPTSSSCLSEITSITFSSGTVTVSYPSGVTPTSGTKLINWSSAPDGTFVFDDGTTTKQFGGAYGDYYMLEADATGLYIRKAVAVDSLPSPTFFYTSVAGALEEINVVYLIAAPDESVTLPVGKTISNPMGVSTNNLTVSPTTDEYEVQYVNSSYTVASTAVTYYWTGAAGVDWGTRSNWKVAAANGPDATRDMETTDSVAFTDGAIVALDATRRVAGIAIDGTVYISAVDAATKSLETTGNITGTGELTLFDVTLANVATVTRTVEPAVNFTSDSELAATGGYGFTFNGAVSISDTIKVWNVNHSVAGTTTLNGNFNKAGGNDLILNAVVVSGNTAPTISRGSITISGAVAIADGATFTIPASGLTVGESASFVLSGRSSVLVDNGSGASGKVGTSLTDGAKVISSTTAGVTTYKVVYGTIFSVW